MNKKLFVIVSASALAVGILFFLLYNNRISVNFRFGRDQASNNALLVRSEKKPVTMWYWVNGQLKNDQREILWSSNMLLNVSHVIASWLSVLDQEEAVAQPSTIQDISFSEGEQELIISLDRVPFGHDDATYDKLMLIESLLKTLRACQLPTQRVRFLVHHQPLNDTHLDFSRPWPIQGFVESVATNSIDAACITCLNRDTKSPFTIMLDPAGDARMAGRVIGDTFERALTFQCVEAIKDYLESRNKNIRVLMTRLPGEVLEPLQNAVFANRLKADLYVSVHMYQTKQNTLDLNFYYYSLLQNPANCLPEDRLTLKPYNEGSQLYQMVSYCSALTIEQFISQTFKNERLSVKKPIGFPSKPLTGIMAPAVAVEVGLHDKDDSALIAEYIARSIEQLIKAFKMA